jgi:uncharacterized protein
MPAISVLIKPSSSACNLRCKYCFYHAVSTERFRTNLGMMNIAVLEQLVKNALSYADGYCCFAFQGGEPTLSGLDFYKRLIEYENKHNAKNIRIENTIQTNGILINDAWAGFLGKHRFLVGLSLDGPKKINDSNRILPDGTGSFFRVMQVVELLRKHKTDFNILSVITAQNVEKPDYLYEFFKKHGFDFLQFIPCLDKKAEIKHEYSLKHGQYGKFLIRTFELWKADFDMGRKIDIRFFSNLVQMAAGYAPEACGMCGRCTPYPVAEGDGSIYPCDFYVTDQWKLGTVADSFGAMLESNLAKSFAAVSEPIHDKCGKCEHFALCRGGCRRWREPVAAGAPSLNSLCADYKLFFDNCSSDIIEMAHKYLRSR